MTQQNKSAGEITCQTLSDILGKTNLKCFCQVGEKWARVLAIQKDPKTSQFVLVCYEFPHGLIKWDYMPWHTKFHVFLGNP